MTEVIKVKIFLVLLKTFKLSFNTIVVL